MEQSTPLGRPAAKPVQTRPGSASPQGTPPRELPAAFHRLREVQARSRDTKDRTHAWVSPPSKPLALRRALATQDAAIGRLLGTPDASPWTARRSEVQSPRPDQRRGVLRSCTDELTPAGPFKPASGSRERQRSTSVDSKSSIGPVRHGLDAHTAANLPLPRRLALMRELCAQPPTDRYGVTLNLENLRRAFWLAARCEAGDALPGSERSRAGAARDMADSILPAAEWSRLSDPQRCHGLSEWVMALNRRAGIEQEIQTVVRALPSPGPQGAIVQPERQTVIFNSAHADWAVRDKALGAALRLHLRRYREELAARLDYGELPSSSDKQALACAFRVCEVFEDMDATELSRATRLPAAAAGELLRHFPSARYDASFAAAVQAEPTPASGPAALRSAGSRAR